MNDEYGIALESAYVDAFEEEGGTVMNRVSFEPEQPSYTSELSEALDGDPDILFIVGFPVSGVQMFRDYYADFADDFDGTIVVPDGLQDPELPGEVGNPMNDVFGTAPSAAGPGADEFQNLYTQEYDRDPGVFTSHGYDAAAVVLLAGIAAGDASGVGVRDNMRTVANPSGTEVGPDNLPEAAEMVANGESVNYQGASSFVDFDDNGDMQAVAYEIFKYTDGEIEVLDLFEFGA